ncbi:MAG: HD-GYP domain-containing protein [Acidimicrobiia bacterium]
MVVPALAFVLAYPALHVEVWKVVAWAVVLAAGQVVRAPGPSGNRFSLGLAVAVALPLTLRGPGNAPDVAAIVAAAGLGLLATWLVRWRLGGQASEVAAYVLRRTIGLAVLLGAFLLLRAGLAPLGERLADFPDSSALLDLLALALAGLVWYAAETVIKALMDLGIEPGTFRYLLLLALGDWMAVVSLYATGALFGFAWPKIGLWAVLVAGLPYAFSHLSFLRFFDTRTTYGQTIQALSRIPEVAGLSPEGHGRRVADLSLAIARKLGLGPRQITELEYAALMHDIGRVTLNEPSILKAGFTDEDIARWGSEIISEAPYLEHVASLVREQHHPYRRPGEERDLELPIESKIIRAASAFDHATKDLGFPTLEAVEVLHRGAAYDFDPQVVWALRRVLQGRNR